MKADYHSWGDRARSLNKAKQLTHRAECWRWEACKEGQAQGPPNVFRWELQSTTLWGNYPRPGKKKKNCLNEFIEKDD